MSISIRQKKKLHARYGEWALVTGASSGIGRELTKLLADARFNLVINSRHLEKLKELAAELKATYSVEVRVVDADLSAAAGTEKLIQACQDLNIGLLISSAGFGTSGLFLDTSLVSEIEMLRVNCEAVLSLTHHFSRKFMQQRRGGIIFLSSLVAFQGVPYAANYAATKAYIQSLAEALAIELKPFGIDVLAASPGPVDSGFGQRANMKMGVALKPSAIGAPILRALGRKTNVVPGLLSKVLVYSLRTVPRWAKIRIMQKVMAGFTRHQTRHDR
jgi:short-subunit dehydrogenase